jgi:hypothetical protein
VEILQELSWRLAPHDPMFAEVQRQISELHDSWQQHKARGQRSRMINECRAELPGRRLRWQFAPITDPARSVQSREARGTGALSWGLVYISCLAREVADTFGGINIDAPNGWKLLRGDQPQLGVNALLAAAMESGLSISGSEFAVLDSLVQASKAEVIEPLLPYLACPDERLVTSWIERSDFAGHWAALVFADAGTLHADTIDRLIDLLSHPCDFLRHRAAISLFGPCPTNRNMHRRFRVSQLGYEVLEQIGRRALRDESLAVRTILGWVKHDLIWDSAEVIDRYIRQAEADSEEGEIAHWLLARIESMELRFIPDYIAALSAASPRVQLAILEGVASIANNGSEKLKRIANLRESLQHVPAEIRNELTNLPKRAAGFLAIAIAAMKLPNQQQQLEEARRLMQERLVRLDDKYLDDEYLVKAEQLPVRLMKLDTGVPLRTYWSDAYALAAEYKNSRGLATLLANWLLDEDPNSRFITDMITALEAIVRFGDAELEFSNFAALDIWEPLLTDWAQNHAHWVVRTAAIRLLGCLRRVSKSISHALLAAASDIEFVQIAAREAVRQFRRIDGDILSTLFQGLANPCPSTASATALLLESLALGEASGRDRLRIAQALEQAAAVAPNVPIHHIKTHPVTWQQIIYNADRLDRVFRKVTLNIRRF